MGLCHSRRRDIETKTPRQRCQAAVKRVTQLLARRKWWAGAGKALERASPEERALWSLTGRQLQVHSELFHHVERVHGRLQFKQWLIRLRSQ